MKVDYLINRQEGMIDNLNVDKNLIVPITKLNKVICLVLADFKCECCGDGEGLTLHHLISRRHKKFFDRLKYLRQRHYCKNIVVLCKKCHSEFHFNKRNDGMLCLSKCLVKKVRQKYGVKK